MEQELEFVFYRRGEESMDYKASKNLLAEWINKSDTTKCVRRNNMKQDSGLRITDKSILGVLTSDYSLITVLNGKIRLFGGDDSQRSSVCSINKVIDGKETAFPGLLVIGDDVCGGIFAINNGFVKNASRGNVVFLPSDSLVFEDLEISHANFIYWCMTLTDDDWIRGGWKTSDKNLINLRESDEYISAKLTVLTDLRKG